MVWDATSIKDTLSRGCFVFHVKYMTLREYSVFQGALSFAVFGGEKKVAKGYITNRSVGVLTTLFGVADDPKIAESSTKK